jgi:2-dehydropantoate 2-reductase
VRTLIVGIGALGGTLATRALAAGMPVSLATRSAESAALLRASGLQLSGVGGVAAAPTLLSVAAAAAYADDAPFELIVLATKAHEALEIAPFLATLLAPGGALLPIQNGGVAQILADRLGADRVVGGLSNLGATLVAPGVFEQRNAGHILIGELGDGDSERVGRIARALGQAIEVRVTANLRGAVWSKLLLNCSVTTLGAIAGQTMRQYIASPAGRGVFRRAYVEALAVAEAIAARPERMLVEPTPPGWSGEAHDRWIAAILAAYGDIKPSMLQDFERGRRTEIDFINGYVADLGRRSGTAVAMNAAITEMVHAIEDGHTRPDPARLEELSAMP